MSITSGAHLGVWSRYARPQPLTLDGPVPAFRYSDLAADFKEEIGKILTERDQCWLVIWQPREQTAINVPAKEFPGGEVAS